MTDDELHRRLGAARPRTDADDGWAASEHGDDALAAVVSRAGATRPGTVSRLRRPGVIGIGLTAAAAVVVTLSVTVTDPPRDPSDVTRPARMSLASFDSCRSALDGLRARAVEHPTAYLTRPIYALHGDRVNLPTQAHGANLVPAPGAVSGGLDSLNGTHSTTNNQEIGADEPDVVKSDGRRLVSVTEGVLRVTDVATRTTTGRLDLTRYSGAGTAQLLVSGDRVLVSMDDQSVPPSTARLMPLRVSRTQASTYLLVDLARAHPRIVSTLRPRGAFVDARLVDGRVRLVVRSAPHIAPVTPDAVARVPLSTWLPSWTVTTGLRTTNGRAACTSLEHPADYTGASMLSIYTIDLDRGFDDLHPVTLAADGTTVYATTDSLYVTSDDRTRTDLHRFDITGPGRPAYLGSGSVAGTVLDAYSLSEREGVLRVVTTSGGLPVRTGGMVVARGSATTTSVRALDADTLRERGHVDGLGRNEQVHGVRFAGPVVYLVTFRQTDPLYAVDLSNPDRPRVSGALKVTGFSDYLQLTGPGRLLGVGSEATSSGRQTGGQVSLFDVDDPKRPSRLDQVVRPGTDTTDVADPHAFLFWPTTRTAFVPLRSWRDGRTSVLVVHVGTDALRVDGVIANPSSPGRGYDPGIVRTVVVGDAVWTLSVRGWQVSDQGAPTARAWLAFP